MPTNQRFPWYDGIRYTYKYTSESYIIPWNTIEILPNVYFDVYFWQSNKRDYPPCKYVAVRFKWTAFYFAFLLGMDLMDISASTTNINNKCSLAYGCKSGGNLQVTSRVYVRLLPQTV